MMGDIAISLGNSTDFTIADGELYVIKHGPRNEVLGRVHLGRATKARFNALKSYLDRLSTHAVED